jgi:hypothetical protein
MAVYAIEVGTNTLEKVDPAKAELFSHYYRFKSRSEQNKSYQINFPLPNQI